MNIEKGKYFVVEGHDGTGKSTQVEMLADYLHKIGIETFVTHEPGGLETADKIRDIIKNANLDKDAYTDTLLFTASRHEIWRQAKRELELGRYVLSARNYTSTLAYQGHGDGIDLELIYDLTEKFVGADYMNPDGTVILVAEDDIRKTRINSRGELEVPDTFESRPQDFQDRVDRAYPTIAREKGYPIINASQSREDIQTEIRRIFGV